jgi:hypothetical protein
MEDIMKHPRTDRDTRYPTVILTALAICALAMPIVAEETTTADTIPTVYRETTTIEVSGKAQSNGTFSMTFKPFREDGVEITVNVAKGMKAKAIAEDLGKELAIAAGPRFKVKVNGTKVKIKQASRKDGVTMALEIVEQKLNGVALMIGK